jgi:hypothetical protein
MKFFITREKQYLLFPLVFSIFYSLQILFHWPLLRIWGMNNGFNFGDLRLVIAVSKCSFRNIFFQTPQYSCDALGLTFSQFPYGTTLQVLVRFLQIKENNTFVLGIIVLLALCVLVSLIIYCLQISNAKMILYWCVIFCSPPIVLLIERMNFDAVMIIIIAIASVFFGNKKFTLGIIVLTLSVLLKFYTLPVFLIVLIIIKDIRIRIISILLMSISIFIVLQELSVIKDFRIGAFASFGAPVYGTYLNKIFSNLNLSYEQSSIFGLFLYIVTSIIIIIFSRSNKKFSLLFRKTSNESEISSLEWLYIICTSIMVSCFVFGNNFEYRLVFLLVASMVYLNTRLFTSFQKRLLHILLFLICWCNYNLYFLQPIGDTFLLIILALFSADIYFNYVQESLLKSRFFSFLRDRRIMF